MKTKTLHALTIAAFFAAGYFANPALVLANAPEEGGMPQAMPVSVATVSTQSLSEWHEFSGRLRAVEDVEVRPRVSGIVDAVHFTEGAIVEKDAQLFNLDLRPFEAALASARADVSAAQAQANLANSEIKRAKKLLGEKALSQREYDERANAARAAEAAVTSAKARETLAALDLEYAQVRAPIAGRVGRIEVTPGNTVQAGMTVLTTMQSVSPIYVDFDIDEQTYLRLMKSVRIDNSVANMKVYMALADEVDFTREGRVQSFDNQLEGSSGTMRVRAVFENENGLLTPGLFARVRLGGAEKSETVVINDAAIGTDQSKRFVYTVDAQGMVNYRPVVLGDLTPFGRKIEGGLQAGENIVVNALWRTHPGMKVMPIMVSMETLQPLAPPPGAPDAMPAQEQPQE